MSCRSILNPLMYFCNFTIFVVLISLKVFEYLYTTLGYFV